MSTSERRDRGGASLGAQWKGNTMSNIDELKAQIESLPSEQFAEIFRWLSEKGWERWDKEIQADSQAGRLDFLVREAREEKAKGTLKDQ
jgi:Fe-S cluster biosynthesis and repair protein YggX